MQSLGQGEVGRSLNGNSEEFSQRSCILAKLEVLLAGLEPADVPPLQKASVWDVSTWEWLLSGTSACMHVHTVGMGMKSPLLCFPYVSMYG